MNNMNNKPMSIQQAADYIGYSVHTLYQMVRKKQIPHHKPRGGKIFFFPSELDEWIRSKTDKNK